MPDLCALGIPAPIGVPDDLSRGDVVVRAVGRRLDAQAAITEALADASLEDPAADAAGDGVAGLHPIKIHRST
jgi:hypothetical protein